MYFSSAFVLVALPFLVGAVLVQNSARSALSIPLSKRSTLSVAGLVDVQNLQASVHHTLAFVFLPCSLFGKDGYLTKCPLGKLSKDLMPSKGTLVNVTPLCRSKAIRTTAAVLPPLSLSPTIPLRIIRCGILTSPLGLLPPHLLVSHYFEQGRRRN
jgi:hypothetical protein